MLISNKLHSFRNFAEQNYSIFYIIQSYILVTSTFHLYNVALLKNNLYFYLPHYSSPTHLWQSNHLYHSKPYPTNI